MTIKVLFCPARGLSLARPAERRTRGEPALKLLRRLRTKNARTAYPDVRRLRLQSQAGMWLASSSIDGGTPNAVHSQGSSSVKMVNRRRARNSASRPLRTHCLCQHRPVRRSRTHHRHRRRPASGQSTPGSRLDRRFRFRAIGSARYWARQQVRGAPLCVAERRGY